MRGQVFFEKTTRPRTPTLKNFFNNFYYRNYSFRVYAKSLEIKQ